MNLTNIQFVGKKAKGRISKRELQENKTRQIFRKTYISYPLLPMNYPTESSLHFVFKIHSVTSKKIA